MAYEEVEERYQMLVFHGPSQTSKSRLARSLFGEDRTLVVDVQHAEHPDLRGFRRHQHCAIVLDEVASPSFIVSNKKVLQAHVDGAILGQSATQLYTYEVFLWRVPIMLTTKLGLDEADGRRAARAPASARRRHARGRHEVDRQDAGPEPQAQGQPGHAREDRAAD